MSDLQNEILRTVRACTAMVDCFASASSLDALEPEKSTQVSRALEGTLNRLEESIAKVERQVQAAAKRGDSPGVQYWDLWRAQLRQKRNALQRILERLPQSLSRHS